MGGDRMAVKVNTTNQTVGSDTKAENPPVTGRGWHGDPERHAEIGRRGGMKVSVDRHHMAEIGRKGGAKVSENRTHMAAIGRKGGSQVSKPRTMKSAE